MSEVTDALDRLASGEATLEETAEMFRNRDWPVGRGPAKTYEEAVMRELLDDYEITEGSFAEVDFATGRKQITPEQYAVLWEARTQAGTK